MESRSVFKLLTEEEQKEYTIDTPTDWASV
jgi:hypothetical protein